MPEVFGQGSRKAGDHAVIGGEAFAGLGSSIAAGKRDNPGHTLVFRQREIKVRNIRDRELEHHLAAIRQSVELSGQFREKDGFRTGFVRALDRDFRLDNPPRRRWSRAGLALPEILPSAQRGVTVKPYPIPRYVPMRYRDPTTARRNRRMCSRRPEAPVASTRKPELTGDPRAA
jgi:hypothetical protein